MIFRNLVTPIIACPEHGSIRGKDVQIIIVKIAVFLGYISRKDGSDLPDHYDSGPVLGRGSSLCGGNASKGCDPQIIGGAARPMS